MGFWSAINPFDGDVIEGVNVRNGIKQIETGQDQDVFGGITNSNRPGQLQINGNYDIGAPGNQGYIPRGGGGGGGGGDSKPVSNPTDVLGNSTGAPGGGSALPALNTGAINNTQLALDQLPALLQAALAAESTRRGNTLSGFNDQEAGQRKTYDQSTMTNQQNYDANYMDSIRAGVGGLGGLLNILRGSGAAGGTAEDMARDTVGGVTSNDIRSGLDTQKANQGSLDSVLSTFLTDLKGKRQAADDTFENNQRAIQRDNASQMQDLYSKMAGYYGDGGRTAEANTFMAKAGSLTPKIAQNSMAKQSAYDTTPVAVQAPQVTAFADPTQADTTVTPNGNQVGSGIFTMEKKKQDQQNAPMALPVGI